MTVTAHDNDGYCDVSADAINDAVEEFNITIVARLRFTDNTIRQQTFESMKVTARSTYCHSFVAWFQNCSINVDFYPNGGLNWQAENLLTK